VPHQAPRHAGRLVPRLVGGLVVEPMRS